jgi:hypothetical protein
MYSHTHTPHNTHMHTHNTHHTHTTHTHAQHTHAHTTHHTHMQTHTTHTTHTHTHTRVFPTNRTIGFIAATCFGCKLQPSSGSYNFLKRAHSVIQFDTHNIYTY